MDKRLTRSRSDRMISGVCAGLAKYINIDVSIVRLIWALATLFGGFGLIMYVVAVWIIPEDTSI